MITVRGDSYRLKEKRRSGLLQKPAAAETKSEKKLERCPEHRKPLARYGAMDGGLARGLLHIGKHEGSIPHVAQGPIPDVA